MVLPLYVADQQVPHCSDVSLLSTCGGLDQVKIETGLLTLGEFQPATASTPPMYGKRAAWPCVCQPYLVCRPLGPSEQAVTAKEREPSS